MEASDRLDPLACTDHKRRAMELRAVRGMNDILPEEVMRWQELEKAFRLHAELHGYAEVRLDLVWMVLRDHLEPLVATLERLVPRE